MLQCKLLTVLQISFLKSIFLMTPDFHFIQAATRHATHTVTHHMPVCEPTNLMVCDIIDYVRQDFPHSF